MTNILNNAKQFVVAGAGITGMSCVRYLMSKGESVRLWDSRSTMTVDKLVGVDITLGRLPPDYWHDVDVLVLSPGLALTLPEVKQAAEQDVRIIGDIELFAHAVHCPVVGVTGSNGKTTVTLLTEYLLKQQGINAVAAGNVGLPALDVLAMKPDVVVLELSSFQLETTSSLHLQAATLLNLSPDHLDRHGTYDAYRQAKQRIFTHAANAVVNRDDRETWPTNITLPQIEIGLNDIDKGFGWQAEKQTLLFNGKTLLHLSDTQLVGLHNAINIQASLALVMALGCDITQAAKTVSNFQAAPHRCSCIAMKNGVKYIDDSKATNIGATEAALSGLGPGLSGRLYLIAGGDAKGADLTTLSPILNQYVDTVIAIGRDGKTLCDIANRSFYVSSLPEAVLLAASLAEPGDTVLMSPACASLDMFDNYQHRAAVFADAVEALPA